LESALPYVPHPPHLQSCFQKSQIPKLPLPEAQMEKFLLSKKQIQKCFRLGRERGLGGGWLGVGAEVLVYFDSIDRLRNNASPQPVSFGTFLVRHKKSICTLGLQKGIPFCKN
jgi:hypothetical protein